MTTSRKKIKKLNGYSWSILISFICATFAMHYHTANISFAGLLQTLPLIIIAVYYSEKLAPLISQPEHNLKKSKLFTRDLFILSFSFLSACLLSLIFSYNNSDTRGWWPLIIYFITLYGLLFSLFFSVIALLIKNHKTYTIIFALAIIVLVSMGQCFPSYTFIPMLGDIETFYVVTCSLLILHCLFIIGYKTIKGVSI
ncbi:MULTISPECIES: hypothetical protein [Legionella]|uniref:Uncharacterized protein n=1 Tax=Legionella drozanskii LLAP-1 TaxID=1212489 RepID=A0A0W0SY37_9GAMM|nr:MULTISPECIES: hypothetical protein [Legionella]KTC88212.1 hypothetical protein Ldro_0806 [Legionella drozanskii LLAP-1]PJE06983.1 MAG: hypothetical protein CK430_14515 [Legionella sp.]